MKSEKWLIGWLILVVVNLSYLAVSVYKVDPYFHYHKPDTNSYFYRLDNQRSQNNGIIKNFDYDALITGTSMTENFKTTEMDEIFGVNSIKVSYSGGSYKEINECLETALNCNYDLKMIVRGLDMEMFFYDKDRMREDLGTYPTYLYDNNPFNDVKYLFNKDIILSRVYPMFLEKKDENFKPGITAFDEYSRWQNSYIFGRNSVCGERIFENIFTEPVHLSETDKEIIKESIVQNVTSIADKYQDVDFYYFFTPYSIVWWYDLVVDGSIYRQIEAEKYVIELLLEHENIHLYSFNNCTDITTDLNNYKDSVHYGEWINSLILKWMFEDKYLLTMENYNEYINEELKFYTSFDYASLNEKEE